ncbi:MAG: HAD family hydrolase, partial [Methanobrevibacter wolinii]
NEIIKKENIKKEEVLYFGDKDADINAAKNAGIDMVLVKYGQGNIKDYENTYPIKIIETPMEILDL